MLLASYWTHLSYVITENSSTIWKPIKDGSQKRVLPKGRRLRTTGMRWHEGSTSVLNGGIRIDEEKIREANESRVSAGERGAGFGDMEASSQHGSLVSGPTHEEAKGWHQEFFSDARRFLSMLVLRRRLSNKPKKISRRGGIANRPLPVALQPTQSSKSKTRQTIVWVQNEKSGRAVAKVYCSKV